MVTLQTARCSLLLAVSLALIQYPFVLLQRSKQRHLARSQSANKQSMVIASACTLKETEYVFCGKNEDYDFLNSIETT